MEPTTAAVLLKKSEGSAGVLRFANGHTVRAKIIHVDLDDREEIIYDILQVIAAGSQRLENIVPGTTAVASLGDVEGFELSRGSK